MTRAGLAMQQIHEANLAWALIDATKPYLSIRERNFAFVTTGAGDTFAAIDGLLRLTAAKRIPLRPQLAQLCDRWLDSYAFHEDRQHLRRCIEGVLTPNMIHASTPMQLDSHLAKPNRSEQLGFNRLVRRAMADRSMCAVGLDHPAQRNCRD